MSVPESRQEIALILWWLHRNSLWTVAKNWWKIRHDCGDAETIERMVQQGREARHKLRSVVGRPTREHEAQ